MRIHTLNLHLSHYVSHNLSLNISPRCVTSVSSVWVTFALGILVSQNVCWSLTNSYPSPKFVPEYLHFIINNLPFVFTCLIIYLYLILFHSLTHYHFFTITLSLSPIHYHSLIHHHSLFTIIYSLAITHSLFITHHCLPTITQLQSLTDSQ